MKYAIAIIASLLVGCTSHGVMYNRHGNFYVVAVAPNIDDAKTIANTKARAFCSFGVTGRGYQISYNTNGQQVVKFNFRCAH
jgi:hypothetical protein